MLSRSRYIARADLEGARHAQETPPPPATRESTVVPTITHRGVTADTHEDKAEMLVGISFSPPTLYDGDEGQEGPPGTAFHAADEHLVARAFRGTSKKSPGPDGMGRWQSRAFTSETPTE